MNAHVHIQVCLTSLANNTNNRDNHAITRHYNHVNVKNIIYLTLNLSHIYSLVITDACMCVSVCGCVCVCVCVCVEGIILI